MAKSVTAAVQEIIRVSLSIAVEQFTDPRAHSADTAQLLDEQLALAALELVCLVDAFKPEYRPVGWRRTSANST